MEKALLFDGNKYPPLLPRPLRVTRAKSITKTASYASKSHQSVKPLRASSIIYRPKQTPEAQSLAGRAGKLLGRAGAAQFRLNGKGSGNGVQRPIKSPEQIIFEGHRARAGHSKGVLKSGKRKGGKPNTRSSKRAAAYKATGRKKRTD